mgnify:CR=1 FL=1
MVRRPPQSLLAGRFASSTPTTTTPDGSSDGNSDSSLVSDVGSEIKVTLDRWSVGQLGVSDLLAALAVVVAGFVVAWLLRRLIHRGARNVRGAALVAVETVGKLAGAFVHLLAAALALEILGFSLGPILILILITIVVLLLLRPMITNLSSGLLLQLRGALDVGDLVRTTRDEFGVVREITSRTTVLDTDDGRRVHVPNSDVLNDVIVNYTSLGHLRTSFDVTVACDEDLDLVTSTVLEALGDVEEIRSEPPPEVQLADVLGRLVVIRVHMWHAPTVRAHRAAIDLGLRTALVALDRVGVELAGPTAAQLFAEHSTRHDLGTPDVPPMG